MHYLYCPITVNGAPFLVKIVVEEYGQDELRGYNVHRIKMSSLPRSHFSNLNAVGRKANARLRNDEIMVSQLYDLVKTYDNDFVPNTTPIGTTNEDGTPKLFKTKDGIAYENAAGQKKLVDNLGSFMASQGIRFSENEDIERKAKEHFGVTNDYADEAQSIAEHVKSADPVTYDDNGNIIPLSQRFNAEENDIRFSENEYWVPKTPKADRRTIDYYVRKEADNSNNVIENYSKWMYHNVKGKNYFAIYSTADAENPTLLYASLGIKAELEMSVLKGIVNEYNNYRTDNPNGASFDRWLEDFEVQQATNDINNVRPGHISEDGRNVALDEARRKYRNTTAAFRNCLKNLESLRLRELRGTAETESDGNSGVRYSENEGDLTAQMKNERAAFNDEYRRLNDIIKGLESERREDVRKAYDAGVKMGIFEQKKSNKRSMYLRIFAFMQEKSA